MAPLRIQADKSQIRPGESVTVTAYGCTNGYIKWKINGNLQPTTDNPFTFNSSGNYSASCNSWDGSYTSEWVTIFIHQLPANTPTITANKTRAYNNESVTLTATGCTTYYWAIPVRQPNGTYVTPTPYPSSTSGSRTVTGPATYQVACTNQGQIPWASVTVYQIQPGDITITSNKTVANSGEAVELNVAGDCPGTAGIQWKIAGENSWTTRYESKTVYGPGTYEARCIVDDLSYGNWASIRINAPAPGGITITSNKTSAGSNELITMVTNGCTGEVIWTLPNNTEVRGTSILFATGPGTYKARCVRFGINSTPATIVIQTKANDAPRFYATQATASGNQIFQLVAENCPNNYVQWGVPKKDANGNTYYDYANFFPTLIVRGPGTYQVRCNEGNYTSFQDIIVFPNPSDALTIVANKAKALPTETVVLTAYGCPNGTVQWDIGGVLIPGVQFSTTGPGNYKARCIGDPTNNGDYAIASILPNGSIVPTISSTHNTACPGESVTLTAYNNTGTNGCPPGWPMQWQYVRDDKIDYWLNNRNAIENFGENYGEVFETVNDNPIVRSGPRVYYVRCMKPDLTWIGEFKDKSFIVEPVFPEYLRASNNGPALMGATGIRVAVTEVPGTGISYAWTGPGGFTSTTRNPEITGLTDAKSGIYTVTVKKGNPVVCSVTATTNLVVSGCGDIRIKATDPANGNETYSLPIVANLTNPYGPLALTPVYRDGSSIPFSTFTWTKPDGTTATGEFLIVNTPGIYKVKVTPNGSTIGCTTLTYIIKENFHTEQWEKAQNLNFKDGTAVTVVPILHKSIEKAAFYYKTSLKESPILKNVVISKLLRYTLPNGTKQSEILYIIPKNSYLIANNYTINPNNLDGFVLVFSENEQQYQGGWIYKNGSPISRAIIFDKYTAQYQGSSRCWLEIVDTNTYNPPTSSGVSTSTSGNGPENDKRNYSETVLASIPITCPDNPQKDPFEPPTVPPNCADGNCGNPGWEWNKPRNGGGTFGNYTPYTPDILKDDYDFNATALNQYRDGITRILSEVGNRYPDFTQFSPYELKLLVTLIRNSLRTLFPNDANSINFADPGIVQADQFKNLYYQTLAQGFVNGFGPLQATNPGIIRNKILNNVDNIVNTFYALSSTYETLGRTQGQSLVSALCTSFIDYGLQKLSMTGQILANTMSISTPWQSISSTLQKQIQIVNSKQEKIVASANANLILTKPDALEETSIIDIEVTNSDNSKSTVNITSDDPPFSTKGAIDMTKCPINLVDDYNELGFPRSKKYFWQSYTDPYNGLSASNKALIAANPTISPIVDEQWRNNVPGELNAVLGEKIEHHHINKGRYAIPRALSLHRVGGWYKKLHPKFVTSTVFEKDGSIFGKTGKTIVGRLLGFGGLLITIIDLLPTENPHSTQNTIYGYEDGDPIMPAPLSGWKQGRIYYIQSMDAYIECQNASATVWTIYDNCGYDESTKKYFGVVKLKESPGG